MLKNSDLPIFEHAGITVDNRGVYTLEIRGAKSVNILNSAVITSVTDAARWIAVQENARVVVVRGAGERAFIAGADVFEMATLEPQAARAFISRLRDLCDAIRNIPVPTIARIQGFCLGGGLELAAACDIRLSADSATFGMPEVRVGIPSVIHAALLPRLIGQGATNWLLFTGDTVDADQALNWGFLQFTTAVEKLEELVERTVAPIVASGPIAIRTQKALHNYWEESTLEDGIDESVLQFGVAFTTREPAGFQSHLTQRLRRGQG